MNRQDLDGLIDVAAHQMVSGEPGHSLTNDVMSRVRGRVEPDRRRFVFAIGTVSAAALGAVVLIVVLNRASAPVTAPQAQRPEMPETRVAKQMGPAPADEPVTPARESRRVASRRMAQAPVQPDIVAPLMPSLEPLATEPIVLSALDVVPLENQAVRIEDMQIEDIEIEPLVASND